MSFTKLPVFSSREIRTAEDVASLADVIDPEVGAIRYVESEEELYTYNGTSWVGTSNSISHNDTSGKQGGSGTDFYHSNQPINTTDSVEFNKIRLQNGTNNSPAYSFAGSGSNTGMYLFPAGPPDEPGFLVFSHNGFNSSFFAKDAFVHFVQNRFNHGSAATPGWSFRGATSTGVFRTAGDGIGFSASGVQSLAFNPSGHTQTWITPSNNPTPGQFLSSSTGGSTATLEWVDAVSGPGPVSNNSLVSFDQTTGNLIKESGLSFSTVTGALSYSGTFTVTSGETFPQVSGEIHVTSGSAPLQSGDVFISTGTASTSGEIVLSPGNATTRGKIRLADGSEGPGTIGYVWTATSTNGSGSWAAPTVPSFSDLSRPAATTVGQVIFNTDDNTLNVADGTNWRDMTGAIT